MALPYSSQSQHMLEEQTESSTAILPLTMLSISSVNLDPLPNNTGMYSISTFKETPIQLLT